MGTPGGRVFTLEDLLHIEGSYCKAESSGVWYARPPGFDGLANLSKHRVVENPDGTITVTPSILVTNHTGRWHGFLTNGLWRKVE